MMLAYHNFTHKVNKLKDLDIQTWTITSPSIILHFLHHRMHLTQIGIRKQRELLYQMEGYSQLYH